MSQQLWYAGFEFKEPLYRPHFAQSEKTNMRKNILVIAVLLLTMQLQAQENKLMNRSFWQGHPGLATVKAEMANGFQFADVKVGDDPISLAITNDAPIEVIKYLIGQPGVDVNRGVHEGRTYLASAVTKGAAELADYLIKKGADMYRLDAHGRTPLTYGSYVSQLKLPVLETFVKNGLDVKKKYETKSDANLLLLAVGHDTGLLITNYLVSKGTSLQSTDKEGNTAFDYAAQMGNVEILKALLQRGVQYTNNALFMAAQGPLRSANKIAVYQYLVDEVKLNPRLTNKVNQNVLHLIVAKQNQADIIAYFFNKGVDINKADTAGNTPFMGAAGSKSLETVSLLLPKVTNINAANAKGVTALMNAIKSSTAEVVELLLKNGASTNAIDKEGNSLAYYLIESYQGAGGRGGRGGGQQPMAGDVANTAAATPQPTDDFGAKVKMLQAKGLDFTALQKDGNTLYHLAIAKNDVALLKKISGLGIDVNKKNREGLTPLHKAAMLSKDEAMLKYLVSIGAKKETKTSFDETAYDLAAENSFLKDKALLDFLK